MALLTCHFFSEALRESTAVSVILPEPAAGQIGMAGSSSDAPPPVLYLLHGLSDDETIWTRRTSIERYAADAGIAVVMPRAGRSFYQDEAYGGAYWTFLSSELPAVVARFFRVSTAREDTFVAGLSMGGYGAMRWALSEPGRFAAAASLSGALDIVGQMTGGALADEVPQVFAGGPVPRSSDLLALLDDTDPARLPALYVACGTEDFLVEDNRRFLARAAERGVAVTVDWRPGTHEWGFWDAVIQDVIAWLPRGGRRADDEQPHAPAHDHGEHPRDDAAGWDERYAAADRLWSGEPNAVLVEEVAAVPPGTALDVGCGEGGDLLWLAREGWRVTGVDISRLALARAAAFAFAEHLDVTVEQCDLAHDELPEGPFDLVTSHFLHPPRETLLAAVDAMAARVAPGGTLLVVGHDASDVATGVRRPHDPDRFVAAAELAARLDPSTWQVEVAEARPRPHTDADGAVHTVRDAVLRARRR
jgi:S-formylglutathione hydrolase FrmB/SAM-dependent methyltransferase